MSRSARIAGVALAAGILAATGVAVATRERPTPRPSPVVVEEQRDDPLRRELARCRTITVPEAGCERAWEANRRRFFGRDRDEPFVPAEADAPAIDEPGGAIGKDSHPADAGVR